MARCVPKSDFMPMAVINIAGRANLTSTTRHDVLEQNSITKEQISQDGIDPSSYFEYALNLACGKVKL